MGKIAVNAIKEIGYTNLGTIEFLVDKNKDFYFTMPFSQTRLADYICVDRSAMLRELKKMSVEGIIDIDKRNVKLCLQYLKKEQS